MGATYISAGAGSGKTHKLTHILADRLVSEDSKQSIDASSIILTTFTKAAAADFVRKAREVLINEKNRPDKAAELDGALIGTVHSICERFIRKYWFELGLTLPLNVLSEEDKKLYMSRIAEIVADEDDVLFFSDFAREFNMNEDFWKQTLTNIINGKYSFGIKDLEDSKNSSLEFIDQVISGPKVDSEDKKLFVSFLELVLELVKEKNAIKETKTGKENKGRLERALSGSDFARASLILSIVDFENESIFTKEFWKILDSKTDLNRITSAAGRFVVSSENGVKLKQCTQLLFDLAKKWEKEYKDFKTKNGLLDFNDMEQLFIRLLTEDGFENVRKDIQNTYKLMMVDEFQDSNPVQIEIFSEMMKWVDETIFVGDSKQAIYGFRGTERSLVEDFINEIQNKEHLKTSYRSRPKLVKAASDIFCVAFGKKRLPVDPEDDSAPYDGVSLHPHRSSYDEQCDAIQHWTVPLQNPNTSSDKLNYSALGRWIHDLKESETYKVVRKVKDENGKEKEVLDWIQYGDIAILLRNGTKVGEIAQALRESGVPVSIQEKEFIGWAEVQLVLSLIRYIINPEDLCSKADIIHLIGGMSTENIIKNAVEPKEDSASPLFERLKAIRSRISVLSVSEIVNSLVLELDMIGNTVAWGLSETRVRNLDFMSFAAQSYEQLCANMNTAPSLPGFIEYVSNYTTEGHKIDRTDTVKVLTCHSAKGLEWPMVILDELDSLDVSDQEIAQKEIRGVHSFRKKDDKQVKLLVFPEIFLRKNERFTSSQSIPEPIVEGMKKTGFFSDVKNRKKEEERNLLYVAFTRAKDYLVTLGYWKKSTDKKKADRKSKYTWLTECGAGINQGLADKGFMLWHRNHPSKYFELPSPEVAKSQENIAAEEWNISAEKTFDDKFLSPSQAGTSSIPVKLKELFNGEKMVQNIQEQVDALCGTCFHRIFAAFDQDGDRNEMVEMAGRIITGMGLTQEFPSPESIIDSAVQLFDWLRQQYGEGTPLHELPVVMKRIDGTIIRGDMDLVWVLPDKKCVLVDYKSFHRCEELSGIKAHAVQHDYPAQLKAYKETLEAGEYEVMDVLIYYFVLGKIIRFEF